MLSISFNETKTESFDVWYRDNLDGNFGTLMILLSGRPMRLSDEIPESCENAAFACKTIYGCFGPVINLWKN